MLPPPPNCAKGFTPRSLRVGYPRLAIAVIVWRAIISSSSVGITQAATLLVPVLMRGPPRALALSSSATPSQATSRHTRLRMSAAFLATDSQAHSFSAPEVTCLAVISGAS
jgi:hypothetical protein